MKRQEILTKETIGLLSRPSAWGGGPSREARAVRGRPISQLKGHEPGSSGGTGAARRLRWQGEYEGARERCELSRVFNNQRACKR
jgi:hypothetical protein